MYTIYDEGGDTEVFERPDGSKERNEFVFTGFGNGIHPYHRKQLNWIKEMLKSAGVVLNLHEVPTVSDMGYDADRGEFTIKGLCIPSGTKPSFDGKEYILVQDIEMGRGWAVLLWRRGKKGAIIMQDHRDNVLNELLQGEWIKSFGIPFQRKRVKDLSKV